MNLFKTNGGGVLLEGNYESTRYPEVESTAEDLSLWLRTLMIIHTIEQWF